MRKVIISELRAPLCALIISALFLTGSAPFLRAASVQQDMQGMPGMDMSKSKPKPKPQPTPQKKRQTTQKKDDMGGMDMSMPMPSPTPSPKPSPDSMENMPGMQMPAATPTPAPFPSPEQMNNMPGMQMPASSPTPQPQASPEQKMDMNMPMNNQPAQAAPSPTASPASSGSMGNMNMNDASKGQSQDMSNMPGMNMPAGSRGTGRMSMGDPNAPLVMAGESMDIRVGTNTRNFISMGQMGSGTSWQPATTPMYMWFKYANGWLLFFHGDLKMGVNSQGGPRGVTKFESQNWFMPMAFKRVGPGTLQLRGMFSAEPFTFSGGGSPELFQTGETYKGRPLVDKQHPHDLFMELAATYTLPLGERGTWFAYFGYPGEPALGPTAFMHRWSASENPSAPLAHHLQDSTHITFGVFTTGFTYRWFKFEGSVFNGREPDENRYNFEAGPWNSRSFRVSFAPNSNWAMQWSYGLLRKPEALEPNTDQRRMTASISYNKPFSRGNWASSLIWGRNHLYGGDVTASLNSYSAESTVQFLDRNYLYTRLELVDKNELLSDADRARIGITDRHPIFRIGAYTFGYARDVWNTEKLSVAVGGDFTFYSKPAVLDPIYGNNPVSYKFFVRIRPNKMGMGSSSNMGSMPGMNGMGSEKKKP